MASSVRSGIMRRRGARRLGALAVAATVACSTLLVETSAAGAAAAGPGIESKAALSAPNCDPETQRIEVQWYAAPPCVRPFEEGDENGGATAQGVTADSIDVVVLVPPADKDRSSTNGGIKDYATGENGLSTDAVIDENAIMAQFWETWGRTVEYEFVRGDRHRRSRATRRCSDGDRQGAVRGVRHRDVRARRWG